MKINWERIFVGLITLISCFALIAADAQGIIDIGKFGYAGVGSWVTIVVQFYYRKQPSQTNQKDEEPVK